MAKVYKQAERDEFKQKPSEKLKNLIKDLNDESKHLIIVDGLPSTGKTKTVITQGMEQLGRPFRKMVYGRPVIVPEFGYLPGETEEKLAFQIAQIDEYISDCSMCNMDDLFKDKTLEVVPLDQLQGRRFRRAWVVLDEVQNVHWKKAYGLLTRRGEGSKYILVGDTSPGQENDNIRKNSLLHFCISVFGSDNGVAIHRFHDIDDIMGDAFTKYLIHKLLPYFNDDITEWREE